MRTKPATSGRVVERNCRHAEPDVVGEAVEDPDDYRGDDEDGEQGQRGHHEGVVDRLGPAPASLVEGGGVHVRLQAGHARVLLRRGALAGGPGQVVGVVGVDDVLVHEELHQLLRPLRLLGPGGDPQAQVDVDPDPALGGVLGDGQDEGAHLQVGVEEGGDDLRAFHRHGEVLSEGDLRARADVGADLLHALEEAAVLDQAAHGVVEQALPWRPGVAVGGVDRGHARALQRRAHLGGLRPRGGHRQLVLGEDPLVVDDAGGGQRAGQDARAAG